MRELTICGKGLTLGIMDDQLKELWISENGDLYEVTPDLDMLQFHLTDDVVSFVVETVGIENEGTVDEVETTYSVRYQLRGEHVYHSLMVTPYE